MKYYTKYALLVAIGTALCVVAYLACTPPSQEAYKPGNLIRLHIIANSDEPEDQAVKYQVRDAILREVGTEFANASEMSQAETLIYEDRNRLQGIADNCLAQAAVPYQSRVEYGTFPFPTRSYYNVVLPAGEYQAVRVVLGQGSGQNWWCVLFPPLCFVDIASTSQAPVFTSQAPVLAQETMASPAGEPQQPVDGPNIQASWRFLEILRRSQRQLAHLWWSSSSDL